MIEDYLKAACAGGCAASLSQMRQDGPMDLPSVGKGGNEGKDGKNTSSKGVDLGKCFQAYCTKPKGKKCSHRCKDCWAEGPGGREKKGAEGGCKRGNQDTNAVETSKLPQSEIDAQAGLRAVELV